MKIKSEEPAQYKVKRPDDDGGDEAISHALEILSARLLHSTDLMNTPADIRTFLQLKLAGLENEVFCCLWLDTQNRLIAFDEMFRGSLTQASVYPREVVKAAMYINAASVIFAHNHPSGLGESSHADEALTTSLKQALALVDVKVLDHFVVAGTTPPMSFVERGLL